MEKSYKDSIFLVYIQYNIYHFYVFLHSGMHLLCVRNHMASETCPSVSKALEQ